MSHINKAPIKSFKVFLAEEILSRYKFYGFVDPTGKVLTGPQGGGHMDMLTILAHGQRVNYFDELDRLFKAGWIRWYIASTEVGLEMNPNDKKAVQNLIDFITTDSNIRSLTNVRYILDTPPRAIIQSKAYETKQELIATLKNLL
jgi:hypothetical protein